MFKFIPHSGPDGGRTLCPVCAVQYKSKQLRLYRKPNGCISARASPGDQLAIVNDFKLMSSPESDKDRHNRRNPEVRIVSRAEHDRLPIPSPAFMDARLFVRFQAAVAASGTVGPMSEKDVRAIKEWEAFCRKYSKPTVVKIGVPEQVHNAGELGKRRRTSRGNPPSSLEKKQKIMQASSTGSNDSLLTTSPDTGLASQKAQGNGFRVKVEIQRLNNRREGGTQANISARKRRMTVDFGTSWDEFVLMLQENAELLSVDTAWRPFYIDADGDLIMLEKKQDLDELYACARERKSCITIRLCEDDIAVTQYH